MSVTIDPTAGTVEIIDLQDAQGNPIDETEAMLLQAAIDRATANTARVALRQEQLREQTDNIALHNSVISKFLSGAPTNPGNNGGAINGQTFTAEEIALLENTFDNSTPPAALSTYFTDLSVTGPHIVSDKSFNDVMQVIKSALNQATNQNQRAMIEYQSLINQRNQMVEWTANLINVLATMASQTVSNLR